jgi:flagellar basal-body rod protein FlgF
MSDTIQMIAAAMRADAEGVRVISQNIANAETVAYRRQVPVSRPSFDAMLGDAAISSVDLSTPEVTVAHDMQLGALKSTGESMNLALNGPGFFVLEAADGLSLTRRGDFRLSADGDLVTLNGSLVMGESGAIRIGSGAFRVEPNGTVYSGENIVDRLRITQVTDTFALKSRGDGSYAVDPRLLLEGDTQTSVRQGFLEASNVSPVTELVQLMETVRRFETEQRFARAYDSMMEKAISELGRIG